MSENVIQGTTSKIQDVLHARSSLTQRNKHNDPSNNLYDAKLVYYAPNYVKAKFDFKGFIYSSIKFLFLSVLYNTITAFIILSGILVLGLSKIIKYNDNYINNIIRLLIIALLVATIMIFLLRSCVEFIVLKRGIYKLNASDNQWIEINTEIEKKNSVFEDFLKLFCNFLHIKSNFISNKKDQLYPINTHIKFYSQESLQSFRRNSIISCLVLSASIMTYIFGAVIWDTFYMSKIHPRVTILVICTMNILISIFTSFIITRFINLYYNLNPFINLNHTCAIGVDHDNKSKSKIINIATQIMKNHVDLKDHVILKVKKIHNSSVPGIIIYVKEGNKTVKYFAKLMLFDGYSLLFNNSSCTWSLFNEILNFNMLFVHQKKNCLKNKLYISKATIRGKKYAFTVFQEPTQNITEEQNNDHWILPTHMSRISYTDPIKSKSILNKSNFLYISFRCFLRKFFLLPIRKILYLHFDTNKSQSTQRFILENILYHALLDVIDKENIMSENFFISGSVEYTDNVLRMFLEYHKEYLNIDDKNKIINIILEILFPQGIDNDSIYDDLIYSFKHSLFALINQDETLQKSLDGITSPIVHNEINKAYTIINFNIVPNIKIVIVRLLKMLQYDEITDNNKSKICIAIKKLYSFIHEVSCTDHKLSLSYEDFMCCLNDAEIGHYKSEDMMILYKILRLESKRNICVAETVEYQLNYEMDKVKRLQNTQCLDTREYRVHKIIVDILKAEHETLISTEKKEYYCTSLEQSSCFLSKMLSGYNNQKDTDVSDMVPVYQGEYKLHEEVGIFN